MIHYPNGVKKTVQTKVKQNLKKLSINSYKNRGMDFEKEINITNQFYLETNRAVITKRPTPINVVKVDYQRGAKITQAYFEKQSTTDYNGIYRGKYIDFEAKSTQSNTSLAIANITVHQRLHLQRVLDHGGIAFLLISFTKKDEVYVLHAKDFLQFMVKETRQSLPYAWIKSKGKRIQIAFQPRIDYLAAIDQWFF
ncbi:MAG: recombination protein [Bacillota bacterium]|jgi:recombination protein U